MNSELQHLRALSELDSRLRAVTLQRSEKQKAVDATRTAVAAAEARCGATRDQVKALQREADAQNVDVKAVEETIAKLSGQQLQAKSNKEYDVFKREIEAAKQQKSELEDGVLERLERIDALQAEQEAAQALLKEAQKALDAAQADAAAAEKDIVAVEGGLHEKREAAAALIDPELRHAYEKLLEQRKDSAMAKVVGGVCSMCSRKITRQMEAMLDVGQEIVRCMSCSRILYLDESAESP
jgi:predicted  nucleic acid-binding Zn-ribbon protein